MTTEEETTGFVFLQSLRAALGRVPLWLLCSLALFALSLPVGLLAHGTYSELIGNRYAPGSLIPSLENNFVIDHADSRGELDETVATLTAVFAFLSILFGIFSAGGWLQVFFQPTGGHSVRRFFHGGVRHFWRFLRVFVLVALGAAAIQWVLYYDPWHELVETRLLQLPTLEEEGLSAGRELTTARLEALPDELSAKKVTWIQDGTHALLIALLLVWAVYTRTRLAMHDATSSLWAGLCTLFTMLRHPIRTLRPMLLLFLVEAVIVFAAGLVHTWMEDGLDADSTLMTVAMIFSLSVVVLVASEVIHAARYQAAILVSRSVIGPISRPDPWKHSIGAPGGPQYPIIEGGDEYGVAL